MNLHISIVINYVSKGAITHRLTLDVNLLKCQYSLRFVFIKWSFSEWFGKRISYAVISRNTSLADCKLQTMQTRPSTLFNTFIFKHIIFAKAVFVRKFVMFKSWKSTDCSQIEQISTTNLRLERRTKRMENHRFSHLISFRKMFVKCHFIPIMYILEKEESEHFLENPTSPQNPELIPWSVILDSHFGIRATRHGEWFHETIVFLSFTI